MGISETIFASFHVPMHERPEARDTIKGCWRQPCIWDSKIPVKFGHNPCHAVKLNQAFRRDLLYTIIYYNIL